MSDVLGGVSDAPRKCIIPRPSELVQLTAAMAEAAGCRGWMAKRQMAEIRGWFEGVGEQSSGWVQVNGWARIGLSIDGVSVTAPGRSARVVCVQRVYVDTATAEHLNFIAGEIAKQRERAAILVEMQQERVDPHNRPRGWKGGLQGCGRVR